MVTQHFHQITSWRPDNKIRFLTLFLLFIYLPGLVFFYPALGIHVASFAIIPVMLSGNFWGMRAGLLAGLLAIIFNKLIIYLISANINILDKQNIIDFVIMILVGGIVGRFRDLTKRIKKELYHRILAEEKLQKSEEKYRLIGENTGDLIAVTTFSLEPTYIYLSPSHKKLGYNPEELVGKKGFDLIHPDDKAKLFPMLIHYIQRKEAIRLAQKEDTILEMIEYRIKDKHGNWHYYESAVTIVRDSLLFISRDISGRKREAERLARINSYLISPGNDPEDNINRLVKLIGELMEGATYAMYNRLERGMLSAIGKWNTPQDYAAIRQSEGQICYDVIKKGGNQPVIIRNLHQSTYVQTDPNIIKYKLQTYIGKAVKCGVKFVGSLGIVYQKDYFPGDSDKEIIGIIASAIGAVEERQQMEERLKETTLLLETIFNVMPDVIGVQDSNYNMIRLNAAGCQFFDITQNEVEGRKCYEVIKQKKPCEICASSIVYRTKQPARIEKCIPGQLSTWFDVRAYPILDDNHNVIKVIEHLRDTTLEKNALEALRESELRYRTLFMTTKDAIFLMQKGKLIECNPVALTIFGCTKEQIMTTPPFHPSLLPPEGEYSREKAEEKINRVLIGEPQFFEWTFTNYDGVSFYAEVSLNRIELMGEHYIQVIVRDITERKRAEEQKKRYAIDLERSNAELQQFASIVSHDLQEPLRMVSSYVQLLESRYRGKLDQNADDFIRYTVEGTERMRCLINDLLAFSRVGTRGKEFAATDCEVVLNRTTTDLKIAIEEENAIITHSPLPVICADSTQMRQLFQNLVGNAIKFRSKSSPRVHISAERKNDEWLFSVRDNGIGIDPRRANDIFEIFRRLHSRDEYPGTGIGLAVCKRIVNRHGGRIWVESGPEPGSTFYFTIPIKK